MSESYRMDPLEALVEIHECLIDIEVLCRAAVRYAQEHPKEWNQGRAQIAQDILGRLERPLVIEK